MDADLALIIGLVVGGLSVPSIMSALSDRRAPRASIITFLFAGAFVLYAATSKPGGYQISEIPNVFFGVLARYLP